LLDLGLKSEQLLKKLMGNWLNLGGQLAKELLNFGHGLEGSFSSS